MEHMDEKITIMFPNEGEYDIDVSIIEKWEVNAVDVLADTVFCVHNGGVFSMKINDYNRIFKK